MMKDLTTIDAWNDQKRTNFTCTHLTSLGNWLMSKNDLFTPVQLFNHEWKNRFVLAPLTRGRSENSRVPNNIMGDYYEQRSTAGLVIVEATVVSEEGTGWVDSPGIYTDEMAAGWKTIVDRVHAKNSKAVLQMWHCGRASHSDFHNGKKTVKCICY